MTTSIIFLIFCILSIDCAPKSKHYLVKVGDNEGNNQVDVDDGMENILDGKARELEDYSDRD